MEVSYKRQMNQSFMIVQDSFEGREASELEMLANNDIPMLLAVEIEVADGVACYWFDITGYQSLADHIGRKPFNMEALRLLLSGLTELYRHLSEYLLSESAILLKEEYIFLDFEGKRLAFSYMPGWKEDAGDAFQELMEQLLQQLDHTDRQAVEAAYGIYQMSLHRELPLEEMMRQALERYEPGFLERGEMPQPMMTEPSRRMEPSGKAESSRKVELSRKAEPSRKVELSRKAEPSRKAELGRKMDLGRKAEPNRKVELSRKAEPGRRLLDRIPSFRRGERGEQPEDPPIYMTGEEVVATYPTELLFDRGQTQGTLCYQGGKGWEDMILGEKEFLIGKKRQEVDGYLPERTVSRIHARIEKADGAYYLEDLNSTNGTFLNGERLEYRQKAKLATGDNVRFGSVEYRFL